MLHADMRFSSEPEQNVLVVDDDTGICDALNRILSTKYNVQAVNTIEQANEMLLSNEFSVVVIDYDLQDRINGIQFAKYVKTLAPLSYTLMLTGHSDFDIVQEALNDGNIDTYMVKPFDVHELLTQIDQAQANYSTKREVSMMLQSSSGIKMAQSLLTQVFDENSIGDDDSIELVGVVISRNSIPVYSNFVNPSYLKKFTDTIFSGFMTAINIVGQEIFDDDAKVDLLQFGEMSIYFNFYDIYQFCFIIKHGDQAGTAQLAALDNLVEIISSRIEDDEFYFNAKNNYMEEIDELIVEYMEQTLIHDL